MKLLNNFLSRELQKTLSLVWLVVKCFEMNLKQLNILTFRVQEFGETQVLLCNVEGLLEVVCCIRPCQLVEFY